MGLNERSGTHRTSCTHASAVLLHVKPLPGAMLTTSLYVPEPPTFPMTTFVISVAARSTSVKPVLVPGTARQSRDAHHRWRTWPVSENILRAGGQQNCFDLRRISNFYVQKRGHWGNSK